jgi:hypothetical protein
MDGVVQLIELPVEAARDGGVSDVGVHFASGGDANAHWLKPLRKMRFVGRYDHPPSGDFSANEFQFETFALSDKLHLRRRIPSAGMF